MKGPGGDYDKRNIYEVLCDTDITKRLTKSSKKNYTRLFNDLKVLSSNTGFMQSMPEAPEVAPFLTFVTSTLHVSGVIMNARIYFTV